MPIVKFSKPRDFEGEHYDENPKKVSQALADQLKERFEPFMTIEKEADEEPEKEADSPDKGKAADDGKEADTTADDSKAADDGKEADTKTAKTASKSKAKK